MKSLLFRILLSSLLELLDSSELLLSTSGREENKTWGRVENPLTDNSASETLL